LAANYGGKIAVLSVAVNDDRATLAKFVSARAITYLVLLGGTFESSFAKAYEAHSAPTNIVISPDGTVVFAGRGPTSLKEAVLQVSRGLKTEAR
jgi:hypothetical protein